MNFNQNKVAQPPRKTRHTLQVIEEKDYSLKMTVLMLGGSLFMLASLILLPLGMLAAIQMQATPVEQVAHDSKPSQGQQDEVVVVAKN